MTVKVTGWNVAKAMAVAESKVELLLGKIAHDIEAWAKTRVPVDTGFLKGSIRARRQGRFYWVIAAGAAYAAYVELGTRHMGKQPYLVPAVYEVKGRLGAAGALKITGPAIP